MNSPDIHTDRLVLRCLTVDDAEWITKGISNPAVHRWLTSPPHPFHLKDAEDFVALAANDPSARAICLGGDPLGVISLKRDLGYWLKEAAWGNGVISEAIFGLLDHHFAHGGGPVRSGWIKGNSASESALRKAGFSDAGEELQFSCFHGRKIKVERVILNDRSGLAGPPRSRGIDFGKLPYIESPRLRTRPLTTADLGAFRRFAGRLEVARMTGSIPSPFSRGQAEDWLALRGWNNPPGFILAVTLTDGTLIGSLGCGPAPSRDLGYLIDPAHAGHGYATEIVRAAIPALFELPDRPADLNACVFTDNRASARVLEKSGFTFVGNCTGESRARLEPEPNWQYRLKRSEYEAAVI